jgi:hypothetical protein
MGEAVEYLASKYEVLNSNPSTAKNNEANLFFKIYLFFIFSFTHTCIQCLGHFSPLPPTPSFSPYFLTTRQKLF